MNPLLSPVNYPSVQIYVQESATDHLAPSTSFASNRPRNSGIAALRSGVMSGNVMQTF